MKESGWIPREQIRGKEQESIVPKQYIAQDPKVANPPSLMFSLKHLMDNAIAENDQKMLAFLRKFYSRLCKWYWWFAESQENPTFPNSFSWQGGTHNGNLPSGLDDYPRGYRVNNRYEIHLDLQTWMVQFSAFMHTFSAQMKEMQKAAVF